MKVIISENRIDKIIRKYLDDIYVPDYGWSYPDVYQKDVEQYGDINFFINDQDSYIYYGCNAGAGPEDEFFAGYGHLHNYKCPLLLIYPRIGQELTSLFSNRWKSVFKEWFEEKSGLHVAQITDDYI
jgi:hypothetical protein